MTGGYNLYHNPAFDQQLDETYAIVQAFGMSRLAPRDNITIVQEADVARVRTMVGASDDSGGIYLPGADEAVIFWQGNASNPNTSAAVSQQGMVVHELAHSALKSSMHSFVHEVFAGAAESMYLDVRREQGGIPLLSKTYVAQKSDKSEIPLEPEFFHDVHLGTNSGLIAFGAMRRVLALSGLRAQELLRHQKPDEAIASALNRLDPTLPGAIRETATDLAGINEAARLVYTAAQRHRIKLWAADLACRSAAGRTLLRTWPFRY